MNVYLVSKHAVTALTKIVQRELRDRGTKVKVTVRLNHRRRMMLIIIP